MNSVFGSLSSHCIHFKFFNAELMVGFILNSSLAEPETKQTGMVTHGTRAHVTYPNLRGGF